MSGELFDLARSIGCVVEKAPRCCSTSPVDAYAHDAIPDGSRQTDVSHLPESGGNSLRLP